MGTERPTPIRTHVIVIEQAKRGVQSQRVPRRPAKSATIPGTPEMAPELELHPAFDPSSTPAVSDPTSREEQAAADADQQRPGDAALQPAPCGSCEPAPGACGK